MSLETIANIADHFQDDLQLREYCNKQYQLLSQSKEIILSLQREVKHLKSLLESSNHLVNSTPELIIKSTEQAICEVQIEKLREVAMERPLTLEETKRLDLLVKNLLLCKGSYKDIKTDYSTLPKGLTSEKLLQIAAVSSLDNT
jgi:DNA replicative helicase MCM subunit Mcm2 (Cdc46/Mcm family)